MRFYSFVDGVFRCEVQQKNQHGYLEYDFNTGLFSACKPAGVISFVWLTYILRFAKLAQKFVEPVSVLNKSDDLE